MSVETQTEVAGRLGVEDEGSLTRGIAKHLLIFVVLLVVWEMANRTGIADPLLMPRPTEIAESIWRIYVTQGNVWAHLWQTFKEAMLGCALGTFIGVALAVSAVLSDSFRDFLKPYVIITECTPRIALGPIFVAWLGFGIGSKISLAAVVCFFAPFVNTMTGLLSVDEESFEMFRSMGATKRQVFWKLMIPTALPTMGAGFKLAVGSAFGGALVAEFISAQSGMGILMARYTMSLNMASAFAALLSITLYGFLLFRLMEYVDYRLLYWRSDELMQKKSLKRKAAWQRSLG